MSVPALQFIGGWQLEKLIITALLLFVTFLNTYKWRILLTKILTFCEFTYCAMLLWIIYILRTSFLSLIGSLSSLHRQGIMPYCELWGEKNHDLHSCYALVNSIADQHSPRTTFYQIQSSELHFQSVQTQVFPEFFCFTVSPAMISSKYWGVILFLSWLNLCFILLFLAKREC